MPNRMSNNWIALVRERLTLNLPVSEQQEVVAELAAHLEDLYDEQIQRGLGENAARKKVLNEVVEWRSFAREIRRAKLKEETMNARTKQLWLPGLASLTAAMILLAILIQIFMQPHYLGRSPLYMVLLPWLALLPLCGATGAYLSRRGGGYRWAPLAAGLFPTMALFVLGSILTAMHLFVPARPRLWYGSLALAFGIILPSISLLLGALPFLRKEQGLDTPFDKLSAGFVGRP
jgi:hypothetical protein